MSEEITLPVEVPATTTTTENVPIQIREITMFTGDSEKPAAITVILGAKDNNGLWIMDVAPVPVRCEGEAATALIQQLMDLNLALSATVAAIQETV